MVLTIYNSVNAKSGLRIACPNMRLAVAKLSYQHNSTINLTISLRPDK
jgi:hypothetical protein